jgi:hypothetical protein
MPTIPNYQIGKSSSVTPDGGLLVDVALDGTPNVRSMFGVTWYELTINYPYLLAADKNALETYYETNKASTSNDIVYCESGVNRTYRCAIRNRPEFTAIVGTRAWSGTLKLRGYLL